MASNDENDLDFLRVRWIECRNIKDVRRLITIAVNALARGDRAEFRGEHQYGQAYSGGPEWDCVECKANYGQPDIDSRHTWTLEGWQKAKWKEVER